MNKLFVHFQVFQFPFKCIYFHEYFQPRVHEMSSFRTFKISFGLFLISWIFLWSNRSASSTAVLPRETWFVQIYLLCMDFTQGLRICQEEGQWNPHYTNPSQNLSHRTLDSALDKTLISHEQNQLTTLKYWLMKRLSLSLRALLEPYPDWWHQNNTQILNISSLLHT